MKIVKFCKKEHNISKGCNTLQLGTFKYYRDMDPSFSIADEKEGFIHYRGPETPIQIGANEFNAISGGGMNITDATTIGEESVKHFGESHITIKNANMVWGEDGVMRADLNGDLDVKLYYPNSYIFCASIIEDGEEPNPKDVAEDYDSHYEINLKDINNFINVVTRTLASQISLLNLKIEGEFENLPLALIQPPQLKCVHRPVEYVSEKEIHLNEADDFIKNRFTQIYIDSIFKKHESYKNDKEYRFVFFVDQPLVGLVSVKEEPILLNIKPIASFVSSKK